jgi:hypothetical protein
MAEKTKSVSDALGCAHAALMEDLQKLQALTSAGSLPELRSRLSLIQLHIKEHFRFEEQNGYMDAVRKREPRLERIIDQLADEHRQIADGLDSLIATATGNGQPSPKFCEEVQHWIERVRQHEFRENDLVQEAFNTDTTAVD